MSVFVGPIEVQLARAQDEIPTETAMPGGTSYDIKVDGFRAPLRVSQRGVEMWSRRGSDLGGAFPDLVAAVAAQVAPGTVLDGEAVCWIDGRLSFDHLLQRMTSRKQTVAQLARSQPASYVAFDLLALEGEDWRGRPWRERREALDHLASTWTSPIELCLNTADRDLAVEWFTALRTVGVEGLVAKGAGQPYRPGTRSWIKVRSRENLDAVVGGVVGPIDQPTAIIAGRLTPRGDLRMIGRSTTLAPHQSDQLAAVLTPATTHPWPPSIGSGHFGGGTVAITRVQPEVVVEVAADGALMSGRYRHNLRLVRLRPDLQPSDIPVDATIEP